MFELRRAAVGAGLCALALATGFTAPAYAAGNEVEVGRNVQVDAPQQPFPENFTGRSSPTIAPSASGRNLLIGFDSLQGLCGLPSGKACPPTDPSGVGSFAFSTDGGHSWTDGGALAPIGNESTAGHSWVDVMPPAKSSDHNASDETYFEVSRLWDSTKGTPRGLGVYRGHFSGHSFTWDDATNLAPPSVNASFTRMSITTAKDGSRTAYVVEDDAIGICDVPNAGAGQIEVWRTHDGGDTWLGPAIVSPEGADNQDPNNPNCGASGNLQVASTVTVGPRGEVYVAWQYGPHINLDGTFNTNAAIYFSRSLDGGETFSSPAPAALINSNYQDPPVGYGKNRLNDQPRLAVLTSGRHWGRIYLGYYQPVQPVANPVTTQSLVSIESFVIYSDNGGVTWSAPAPIGPPVPPTGLKRFWPTIAIGDNNEVDVEYLESQEVQLNPDPTVVECNVGIGPAASRSGAAVSLVNTYMVQSTNGGVSFGKPIKISSATSNWCKAAYTFGNGLLSNFGDYIGFDTLGSSIFSAWPDGRTGYPDIFFAASESN
jgi:hypothetical protein